MPRQSIRAELVDNLLTFGQIVLQEAHSALAQDDTDDSSSDSLSLFIPTPPTPPILGHLGDLFDSSDSDNTSPSEQLLNHFAHVLQGIQAELDEVLASRVLFRPVEPPEKISQLPLLHHHAQHHPELFQKKL
ncbi:hypothetical protein F5141DRAFT_1218020 [Pisolithus sp. B1]|nr:hypothetical protein F5141DRAFT_1218020 [Pisolithus sp. B1]